MKSAVRRAWIGASAVAALVAALVQTAPAPAAGPANRAARAADFVLTPKTCTQLTSKVGGKKAPLQVAHVKWRTQSCWRTGPQVACNAEDSTLDLRVNRESGQRLLLTGEGGLVMIELDWLARSFASGITTYDDELGIMHLQCSGKVDAGPGHR